MTSWWSIVVALLGGLGLLWILLLGVVWTSRPDDLQLADALRLLPDLVRLLGRLATSRAVPVGVRLGLWLLLAYLASPIDLVPDFIPVIGYADDAVVVALGLRAVVRHAGEEALADHWPGTAEGLKAVRRLAGVRP